MCSAASCNLRRRKFPFRAPSRQSAIRVYKEVNIQQRAQKQSESVWQNYGIYIRLLQLTTVNGLLHRLNLLEKSILAELKEIIEKLDLPQFVTKVVES